jgi:Flp pilus assembly protein TadG
VRPALRRGRQVGAVTAELIVATPLLLLLISMIVQYALYEHAAHIAQSAAQEAATAVRVQGGSLSAGQQQGQHVIHALGAGLLVDPTVTVETLGSTARVEVTGYAEQIVPLLRLSIDVVAAAPLEPSGGSP